MIQLASDSDGGCRVFHVAHVARSDADDGDLDSIQRSLCDISKRHHGNCGVLHILARLLPSAHVGEDHGVTCMGERVGLIFR